MYSIKYSQSDDVVWLGVFKNTPCKRITFERPPVAIRTLSIMLTTISILFQRGLTMPTTMEVNDFMRAKGSGSINSPRVATPITAAILPSLFDSQTLSADTVRLFLSSLIHPSLLSIYVLILQ